MTDTLEFPTIDEAAITPPAATVTHSASVAVVTSTDPAKLDLTKLDLEAVALAHFEPARAALADATKKLAGVVHDLSTAGKLADAKSLRHRLVNIPLAEARKVSTGLKSKLTATSKAVGAELVNIEMGFEAAEALITPQIEARDVEIEAERQRKEAEAAARREKFEGLLSNIRGYGTAAKGLPAARILAGIAYVEDLTFGPEWEEYAPKAAQAQAETLTMLRALHADAVAAEQAAAVAEALRVENECKAAELAEQRRVLAEQQRRMESIRRINAHCADAQAAIVGKAATDAVTTLETFVSATASLDVSVEAFGDLAPMASMAQSMTLTQLRSMLAEAQARVQQEADEKTAREEQEAEDRRLSEANAALQVAAETAVAEPIDDERPVRDWPDLQATELACAPAVSTDTAPVVWTFITDTGTKRVETTMDELVRLQADARQEMVNVAFDGIDPVRSFGPRIDVAVADPEPALPALLAHIAKAFDTRFPTQPKPGIEWWAELKRLAGEVRA